MPFSQGDIIPGSKLVERALEIHYRRGCAYRSLEMALFYVVLLFAVVFSIKHRPSDAFWYSFWYILEYIAALILGACAVSCALEGCIYLFKILTSPPLVGTKAQRELLSFSENDRCFVVKPTLAEVVRYYARENIKQSKGDLKSLNDIDTLKID